VLDTSFIIGFLVNNDADMDDVARYFRALQRAQRDIDLEPERYKHYFLKEIPAKYQELIDLNGFGTGERLVFEPYTREMFETTHRWMIQSNIFQPDEIGAGAYEVAVSA
jgi:NitT/TauT family transport system substrate-binding protein